MNLVLIMLHHNKLPFHKRCMTLFNLFSLLETLKCRDSIIKLPTHTIKLIHLLSGTVQRDCQMFKTTVNHLINHLVCDIIKIGGYIRSYIRFVYITYHIKDAWMEE